MAKIVFTKTARFDLKEIIDFIKRDSIRYAYLEKKKVEESIDKLMQQPLLGRVVPDLNDNFRELISGNYRIIYQVVSEEKIYIFSIHHHSRLLSNNPAFKPEE